MAAIAPMDLVMKSDPATIPLRCTLCPKRPNFSDVSHLLTHISSKSHLSHRFKAELMSHSEREAQEAIRLYDDWYERHGIRGLLAERMAAKEQKKTGKRGRPSHHMEPSKFRAVSKRTEAIKAEPEDFTGATPAIARWSANSHSSIRNHNAHHGYFDSSGYQTPVLKRSLSEYSMGTPDNMANSKYRRWPSETETTESAPASEIRMASPVDDEGDLSKLKGVRYPGMGLFDAASEQARRRRNQRKDESVLRLMEKTSSIIEPTEYIWTDAGVFERTRDIYATPSLEGSPAKETYKKKRGRRASTTAVTAKPRQTRYSTRTAKQKNAPKRRDDEDDDDLPDEDEDAIIRKPTHSHASMESYDVFRGRSKPSREAPKPAKPLSYFSGDNNSNVPAFSPHPPVSSNPYFQHQQSMGTYNPLYVQTRNGYFHPYSYSSYGAESKPTASNFQAVNNTVNPNLTGMAFHSFQPSYGDDSSHQHQRGNGGFDM
ncbi:hypothetical protein B0T16DRAFT_315685 [Cercophora newfieldiana]|uniref:Uncharacterized protein n=1 Tax=Cercophora newfieldiana TaxID=92897 RepID=A0AA40D061_9PEZI|nr:hypothetical protein B0T16DRAFT_315685 [Cercophora newfieldiana]